MPLITQQEYKAKDVELWRKWKSSRNPMDLQKLLDQLNPIIQREVNKWAPSMSRSFLDAHAKRLAVEAIQSYDPNKGAALSTHLASRLQKISRVSYQNLNAARVSESNMLLYNVYSSGMSELKDKLGRDPTHVELSDHLGWTPRKLEKYQRQIGRSERIESEEHGEVDTDVNDFMLEYIYHDLTPMQQKIFEHSSGYMGAPILSGRDMMKKLKITQGQLSYQKSLIEKVIKKAQETR